MQIPNRPVTNIINYPRRYLRCIADVTLATDSAYRTEMAHAVQQMALGVYKQFPGIVLSPPSIEGQQLSAQGRHYLRIKFRIRPGRGAPIEEPFRQEAVHGMREFDPDYDEWMVAVFYELEDRKKSAKLRYQPPPEQRQSN